MDQIIDIATDGRYLARERGFLKVSEDGKEIGRTPLDQIIAVIVHAHGITWSNTLLAELADRGVPVVICGANHAPRSVLMPLDGNYMQGARIRAQWNAKTALLKQAWKQVVVAKIKMQIAALKANGQPFIALTRLARKVTSGDTTNVEAQAARAYWPLMMGRNFKRDTNSAGTNALLNYGYTVLRAATARSVVAAGLHPSIGIHHSNQYNAFALADDLMEPFRPLVDCAVCNMTAEGIDTVNVDAKSRLARLIAVDVDFGDNISPVSVALSRLAISLAQKFEHRVNNLDLPQSPLPLTLAVLGR